jgi:ABC-type nitrate/sulfonate/bicarbonate transport system substrate-binding protein
MKSNVARIVVALALVFLGVMNSREVSALTIKVGYPQLSGGSMPVWVINETKLDRRYGVDISSIYVPGGARLTQSLIAGDIDIALTGGAVVTADLSGADLTYVAIGLSTYGFYVYARPEIKEVRDLSGKILGVITKGASSDHAAIALIRRYGMREGQDVKFLYFSRQEDLLAALNQGIVPAGVLACPTNVMAQRLGFKELVDISSFKLPYPHNAVATRRPLLRQNPDLFRGFLKTYLAAIKIIHEEPAITKRALARFLTKDSEMIDDSYRRLEALFLKVPYMPEEAIRSVLTVSDHPKASSANPKDFFDNRILKELEDTGFVKELYSRR